MPRLPQKLVEEREQLVSSLFKKGLTLEQVNNNLSEKYNGMKMAITRLKELQSTINNIVQEQPQLSVINTFRELTPEQMAKVAEEFCLDKGNIVDKNQIQEIYNNALKNIQNIINKYKDEKIEIPERINNKLHAILFTTYLGIAIRLAKKAEDGMQMHIWSEMAKGKIGNEMNYHEAKKKAKSLESLANYLDKQGKEENANRCRQKAQELLTQYNLNSIV